MIINKPALDWLTLTTWDEERKIWWDSIQDEMFPEFPQTDQRRGNYRGVASTSNLNGGSLFTGSGLQLENDHHIFHATGAVADAVAPSLVGDIEQKCTRIDFQMTVPIPDDVPPMMDFLAAIDDGLDSRPVRGRKPTIMGQFSSTDENGVERDYWSYTIYIGSPSSDRRIRFYIKTGDDGTPHLRFEVQLRQSLANIAWTELAIADSQGKAQQCIADILLGELDRLGDIYFGIIDDIRDAIQGFPLLLSRPAKQTSNTVQWLYKAVVPCLKKIAKQSSDGGFDIVSDVLYTVALSFPPPDD